MEFASVQSPAAAFVAGLVTSLHCAGMCGPLACWLSPSRSDEDATTLRATYQSARLLSYGAMGAVAGAAGSIPLAWAGTEVFRYAPWALVLFFVAVALRIDKRLRKPAFAVRTLMRIQTWVRGRSRMTVAAVLGGATPLVPCGPLYFIVALAALSGSAVRGIEFMLAFGLGTLPLLWLVQAQFGWVQSRLSPIWIARLQAGFALIAALVISWRLRSTLGFAGPSPTEWICFPKT
ncbi:sulfite exporter TauE/SafE family protein [Opitutaceae bacterium EW11]|nr:sulfite exporter TauE/SafE family protein [Opitutaceae bacterium EW11]